MLYIEIADTPFKLANGLMFRKTLAEDSGMLFKFSNPNILKFWGFNTYIPLDIAFISEDNKIAKISYIKPLSTQTVSSDIDCIMAIEVNAGYFASHNIKVGDEIDIDQEDDQNIIYFGDRKKYTLKDVFS